MSLLDKIERLKSALQEEKDPDAVKTIKAVIVGMTNYNLGLQNSIAKDRFEKYCSGCAYNVQDPIPDMRVQDKAIPELSERMCAYCNGCVLSYKLRQSVKPCEFWK